MHHTRQSDFSAFALFVAGLTSIAGVSAVTEPTTGPSGNPISKPGLNELVPVGEPFTITWEPTCDGTVTVLLLRGPGENIVQLGDPIVEETPNDGEYEWTPSGDLEADESRYGLQLICDATGEFQYSTQFGIANDGASTPPPTDTDTDTDGNTDDSDKYGEDVYVPPGYDNNDKIEAPHDYTDDYKDDYKVDHKNDDKYDYKDDYKDSHSSSCTGTAASKMPYEDVVSTLITYIPEPSAVVINNKTFTVTEPTTLTVTDCPCIVPHVPGPNTNEPKPFPIYPPFPTDVVVSTGFVPSVVIQPTGGMSVPGDLPAGPEPTTDGLPVDVDGDDDVVVDGEDVDGEEPVQFDSGADGLLGGSRAIAGVAAAAGVVVAVVGGLL